MYDILLLSIIFLMIGLLIEQDVECWDVNGLLSVVSIMCLLGDEDVLSLLVYILVYVVGMRLEMNRRGVMDGWMRIFILVSMGIVLIMGSEDLLILYGGIEMQSMGMYILLVNSRYGNEYVGEGGMKYLVISCVGSGILLLGSMMYYSMGYYGLDDVVFLLVGNNEMGVMLIVIGLLIKVGMFPVVDWIVSVIEGVEDISGMILSNISKLGYIVIIDKMDIWGILDIIGLMSLMSSGISCYYTRRLKRFVVYSSIGHIGLILLSSDDSMIVYLLVYMLLSWCMWEMLMINRWTNIEDMIESRKEESKRLTIVLIMCILSGIPPFIGFIIKLGILLDMIDNEMYKELTTVMIYILMSSYNYIRIVRVVYFDNIRRHVLDRVRYDNGNEMVNDKIGVIMVFMLLICVY